MPDRNSHRNDAHIVALEVIRGQLENREETIGDLLLVITSIPKGRLRDKLMDEFSSLDSIADVMRQALDTADSPRRE